jgi:hypothetical protein
MMRVLRLMTAICLISALGACDAAADASRSFGNGEFVNDVAGQLATAESLAYTAVFSLADNETASIAHRANPTESAYRFPGGVVLLSPTGTMSCKTVKGRQSCARSTTASLGGTVPPALESTIDRGGLVRPETVVRMLTQMSLNADALISEQTRTIAGATATCVTISGVPEPDGFTACVTSDGLLGAFSGTVTGVSINIELDHYTMSVKTDAFATPPGAKITG